MLNVQILIRILHLCQIDAKNFLDLIIQIVQIICKNLFLRVNDLINSIIDLMKIFT